MQSTLSSYRTIRLSLHPRPDMQTVEWAVVATRTERNVPRANIVASGSMILPSPVHTRQGIIEAVKAVVSDW